MDLINILLDEKEPAMNSLVVGGILKRFYTSFDMKTFSNRLKLQKIIYLVQANGIHLGYSFSWYLHGPYSADLTKDAYQLEDFSKVKKIGFEDPKIEAKFNDIENKIGSNKDSDTWLEVSTSIHLLKKLYPTKTKEQIISDIQCKCADLKKVEIEIIWSKIEGWLI